MISDKQTEGIFNDVVNELLSKEGMSDLIPQEFLTEDNINKLSNLEKTMLPEGKGLETLTNLSQELVENKNGNIDADDIKKIAETLNGDEIKAVIDEASKPEAQERMLKTIYDVFGQEKATEMIQKITDKMTKKYKLD